MRSSPLKHERCNKGLAFNGSNKFEDAIVAFDKAIEIKPKFADAWNGKGVVLGNMGKYDEAIQAYNKATTIRPKFTLACSVSLLPWIATNSLLAN